MDIRIISSVTPEDEARIAPALIELLSAVLDSLSVAYTLRIDTAAGETLYRSHPTLQLPSEPGDQPQR